MAWRRQWCHLCELPKPPWALVGDFSQAVCRGCANFEGATRVELLLATARHLRGHHGATSLSPSVPKEMREASCTQHRLQGHHGATSLSPSVPKEMREASCTQHRLQGHHGATSLSLTVPKELREALCGQSAQGHHEATSLSPSVPRELRDASCTEHHLRGHHEATSLSPSVPKELSQALCGRVTSERRLRHRRHHRDVTAALPPSREVSPSVPMELSRHRDTRVVSPSVPMELSCHRATRAVSPSVPMELSDALCGRVTSEGTEHRHHASAPAMSPAVPAALERHHATSTMSPTMSPAVPAALQRHQSTSAMSPTMSPTVPAAFQRHHATSAMSPSVPTALQRHHATSAMSPSIPTALQRHHATSMALSPCVPAALSAALAEAWPGKPRAVRERLSVLAGCAPFFVRLRKHHALVGRVLAFDAAPRGGDNSDSGGGFELRLFAEYPCGSGSVYGALGLARRMLQDCPRAPGKFISSGYKYLEYEKRQGSGEWRLLAELFTESVRLFRLPPSPEALPQQQRRHLSLSPLSPPAGRCRKACPEARVVSGEALSCGRCRRLLEDTHFVQCPAVPRHRFCFPCARRAIRARGPGRAVHCPSGGRCALGTSGLPWAFMQGEIAAILAGEVRVNRDRDP